MNQFVFKVVFASLVLGALLVNTVKRSEARGLFDSHMVLQRDLPIQIWGTADNDEKIEVTRGSNC